MKKTIYAAMAVTCMLLGAVSCEKDDPEIPLETGKANYFVSIDMAPLANNGYIVPLTELSGTATFTNAVETRGWSILRKYGEDVFLNQNLMDGSIIKYTRNDNGGLTQTGQLQVGVAVASVGDICIASADKAYASAIGDNKIIVFNPTTMQKLKEIDLSVAAFEWNGRHTPTPLGMCYNNGKLYVGCPYLTQAPMSDAGAHVLIVNTTTDEPIKMIHDDRLSSATYFTGDIFADESNSVYVHCYASSGYVEGQKGGFLKIDGSTDEFDSDFCMNLDDRTYPDVEGGKLMFTLGNCYYAGNDEVFFYGYCPAFCENLASPNFVTERTNYCMKANLSTQAVEVIDLPRTNSYSSCIAGDNENIYFGLSTESNGSGLFTYNLHTHQCSPTPVVNINSSSINYMVIFDE